MPTFEQLLDRYESWHPSIIVDIGCRLHQSPPENIGRSPTPTLAAVPEPLEKVTGN
jgi:hypothetical protein